LANDLLWLDTGLLEAIQRLHQAANSPDRVTA